MHGQGTLTHPSGQKYTGEFQDDWMHGQGTLTRPDGLKYLGDFKKGKPDGKGTFTLPSGIKYVGDVKNGKEHGQDLTHPSGQKYVGNTSMAKIDGQGDNDLSRRTMKEDSERKPVFGQSVNMGLNLNPNSLRQSQVILILRSKIPIEIGNWLIPQQSVCCLNFLGFHENDTRHCVQSLMSRYRNSFW